MTTATEGARPEPSASFDISTPEGWKWTLEWLQGFRKQQGLTQADVATSMGTTQSAVSRLEAGEVDPTVATVARYIRALGLKPSFNAIDMETGAPLKRDKRRRPPPA